MLQVILICLLGMLGAEATDYTKAGPYGAQKDYYGYVMPTSTGCRGWSCHIKLTVTRPTGDAVPDGIFDRSSPFPVVFMFNGFQTYASYYKGYVDHLVSYGYVVIQYDTKKMVLLSDKIEMGFFPYLLAWARSQNAQFGGPVYKLLDLDRVGVAGHSRGGKLATFHIAHYDIVKSAYLIDPVDGDNRFATESDDYPSAVKELAGKGHKIGIVGSGVTGRCNPEGHNYKEFYKNVGIGSWLTVVNAAGHCQYIDAPAMFEWAMSLLCGHGADSCMEVISVTRPGMVAWFEQNFRAPLPALNMQFQPGKNQVRSFLDGFFAWIRNMEQKKEIHFTVKDGSDASLNGLQSNKIQVT